MTTKSITSTEGQRKQYRRFVEDAAEKALIETDLDKERLQKLLENGGEFQADIIASIRRLSVSNQFADEEVASTYGYGSGYNGSKPIAEQAAILRAEFQHLGSFDETLVTKPLPAFAEGYFAISHWSLVGSTYQEAVEKVMAAIASRRAFFNYREGQLGPQQLKETVKKAKAFEQLRAQQVGNDILVVAGQFGLRHAGRPVRRAREVMSDREFGLGAYEVAIMHLTHPERLVDYNDLWVDCAGDEAAPGVGEAFSRCPHWDFYDGKLMFNFRDVDGSYECYGSASGCSPECES